MKILSLLFSLLLGAGVLLFFLQPWNKIEKMLGGTGTREAAPLEFTAAVEAAPPKPAEVAPPHPGGSGARCASGHGARRSQDAHAGKRKG